MIKNLHMTDLATFQQCRRKFYYDKVRRITLNTSVDELDYEKLKNANLNPEVDPEFYFTFGKIGHKVLEEFYNKKGSALDLFRHYGQILNAEYFELGSIIFQEYDYHYASDLEDWEVILTETPLEIEVAGQPISMTVDLLVKNKTNNAVFAVDHKFYSRMPSIEEMRMRDQFTGYSALLRKSGFWVDGIIVNIIRKSEVQEPKVLINGDLSLDKAQKTTYFKYLKALEIRGLETDPRYADILEFLKTADHPLFRRDLILKTKAETDYWLNTLPTRLEDINIAVENPDKFYLNTGYHCINCKFNRICQSVLMGGDGQGYIETLYREKTDHER